MNRMMKKGFTLVELMVVIGILGLLVGILAVAVIPKLTEAGKKMEIVNLKNIFEAVQLVQTDKAKRGRLTKTGVKDASGYEFYSIAIKKKILSDELLSKIISLGTTTDEAADSSVMEEGGSGLSEINCSYTAPKGGELMKMMKLKGSKKKVLICFNTSNWGNYDGAVIVQWTSGEVADYVEFDDLPESADIDAGAWETGDGIIGEKAPFDKTYNGGE